MSGLQAARRASTRGISSRGWPSLAASLALKFNQPNIPFSSPMSTVTKYESSSDDSSSSDDCEPRYYRAREPTCETHAGGLFTLFYRVCSANQYLVKTGLGLDNNMIWAKKTFQWPFQTVVVIPLAPRQLEFDLHMMSSEKVPFQLPMVWTVGPYSPDVNQQGFLNFAQKMSSLDVQSLEETVRGVVHGTTRTLTAAMTIQELFHDREKFKIEVHDRVEKALMEFGICCYNSNIAEMKDLDENNKYFENLKQKALEEASADARIAVSEARRVGDVGECQRQAAAKVEIAAISSQQLQQENIRQEEVARSNMSLQLVRYECQQTEESKRVETDMAPKRIQAERQTELNKLVAQQQIEELRSTTLAHAKVEAEATVTNAEAQATATRLAADAQLYAAEKEAAALLARAEAQAEGLAKLLSSSSDPALVQYYLALDKGLFEEMAMQSANAIQGLAPKINIWSTGNEGGDEKRGFNALQDVFKSMPPMLDAIQSQTGMQMPSWAPSMPQQDRSN